MNENKIDLLKNLLSLYFNYSKDFFEEIMNSYFKPIEKSLYNLLLENFDDKLQKNDYIIYSDLIRKLDKYLNNYLYLFQDNLDDIINNTKKRNLRLQNINKALESLFDIKNKFERFNPLAFPCAGDPALKYGYVNTVTPSSGEVKGLIIVIYYF